MISLLPSGRCAVAIHIGCAIGWQWGGIPCGFWLEVLRRSGKTWLPQCVRHNLGRLFYGRCLLPAATILQIGCRNMGVESLVPILGWIVFRQYAERFLQGSGYRQ